MIGRKSYCFVKEKRHSFYRNYGNCAREVFFRFRKYASHLLCRSKVMDLYQHGMDRMLILVGYTQERPTLLYAPHVDTESKEAIE